MVQHAPGALQILPEDLAALAASLDTGDQVPRVDITTTLEEPQVRNKTSLDTIVWYMFQV